MSEQVFDNPFDHCSICILNISVFQNSKRLKLSDEEKERNPWLKKHTALFDSEGLKVVEKLGRKARQGYLYKKSLDFPIKGFVLVPYSLKDEVQEKLEGFKQEFHRVVREQFGARWETLKLEAREILGDAYDPRDYPNNIEDKFIFRFRWVSLTFARGDREQFEREMREARDLCILALREEFVKLVDHLRERLTPGPDGKLKTFQKGTIENFAEFFSTFDHRNVFNDIKLSEMVDLAQGALDGVVPQDIRDKDLIRESVRQNFEFINERLEESIISGPSRRLKLN